MFRQVASRSGLVVSAVDARAYYARLVTGLGGTNDERLIDAFAAVERERFVGPGPWRIFAHTAGYIESPSDDPAFLYADVLVALIEERGLNNGEPSLHTRCIAALQARVGETAIHIGAGTGYYTAILAHMVGPTGAVIAYEIDQDLAKRAATNLMDWPQVKVRGRSGTGSGIADCDLIYVSAGATSPPDEWLDALRVGGRLLFPLTPSRGMGGMLLITRSAATTFDALFVQPAMFIDCEGARDPQEAELLSKAFARGNMSAVKSLHRNSSPDDSSWYAARNWWLSTRANTITQAKAS